MTRGRIDRTIFIMCDALIRSGDACVQRTARILKQEVGEASEIARKGKASIGA
jgi:hypothetical protein